MSDDQWVHSWDTLKRPEERTKYQQDILDGIISSTTSFAQWQWIQEIKQFPNTTVDTKFLPKKTKPIL